MKETTAEDAAQLASDLDKMPSGEVILEKLLTGMIVLKRENQELKAGHAELKAQFDQVLDKLLDLTNLVHGHEVAIQLLQAGSGVIVN